MKSFLKVNQVAKPKFLGHQNRFKLAGAIIGLVAILVFTFSSSYTQASENHENDDDNNSSTKGSLTVTKIVNNEGGGTLHVADFTLTVTDSSNQVTDVTSGHAHDFSLGNYTVGEVQAPNYTGVISGDCNSDGTINIKKNKSDKQYHCTITNTFVPPIESNTTFNFIKEICPSYTDIAGNANADDPAFDQTDGQYVNFTNYHASAPHFNPLPVEPVAPAEIPEACTGAAGWSFLLSTNQAQTQNTQTVGLTGVNGTLQVNLSDLIPALQTAVSSGHQLWVSEVAQDQVATFGAIRCYKDALNGDNLEFIQANSLPSNIYCIAYNVGVNTPPPPVCVDINLISTPATTQTAGWTNVDPNDDATALTIPGTYNSGSFGPSVATTFIGGAWVDPTTDVNFAGSGAVWVSTTVAHPGDTANGGQGVGQEDQWRLYKQDFTIPSGSTVNPITLNFTADNAVTVYFNGVAVANTPTVPTYTQPTPDPLDNVFGHDYSVVIAPVVGVTNHLEFVVRNSNFPIDINPTGLLYSGHGQYCPPAEQPTTGHIIVDKVTDPSGDPTSFHFQTGGTGYTAFDLTDAAAPNNQELAAGSGHVYGVHENPTTGWTQTSFTCTSDKVEGNIDPNAINLQVGETVNCTTLNTKITCQAVPNLLINGGFETPQINDAWDIVPSGASGLGWTVAWTSADAASFNSVSRPATANLELQHGVNGWLPSEGTQYTELDSDWDGPAGPLNGEPANVLIEQTVPTQVGATYNLSFDFSPRPGQADNQMEVFWNGVSQGIISANGSANSNTVWTTHNMSFPGTAGTSTLGFKEVGTPDSLGSFLDNVILAQNCTPPDNGGGGQGGGDNNQAKLTVTISAEQGDGSGTVTSNDDKINCHVSGDVTCNFTYTPAGNTVTLTAQPDSGSTFIGTWSGDCSGDNPVCQVTMNVDRTVNAHFSLLPDVGGCSSGCGGSGSSSVSTGGGPCTTCGSGGSTPPPATPGAVAGASTTNSNPGGSTPPGQVLGATLPRTGIPASFLYILLALVLAPLGFSFLRRAKKA